ncbi:aminoglycoside phosphotransferase family protein [Micromonospora sp. S-DT3-3-22]|uniref:aminoglycoside phosphotransferase family protein n=1 Tax=Micromonospora sp. S-DT3-3-22 TaxID=2755359 RepID=UPI00188F7125|nr:aminoglycoside phosphotransferase family protein [Micromonospora sp. S-DT3-3-22]
MRTTRSAVLLGFLLALLSVPLAPATPAAAHAALVATSPVRDAVIGSPPGEVVLVFSESVSPVVGRVQVLGPDGRRVTAGEPVADGATLRIPVRVPDRPLGTYLVSYRVISADSHPVAGSFAYSAGAPSATPPEPVSVDERPSGGWTPAARYVGYLGLVLAVGPTLFGAARWPRRRRRRAVTATGYVGLALVAVGTAGTWVAQAADMVGVPVGDLSRGDLTAVAGSDVGPVLGARLALAGIAAGLLTAVAGGRAGRGRRVALAVVGLAGLVTWPLAGHPVASPLPPVSILADVVHLAGMSVWLGGLFTLAVFLLPGTHRRVLGRILPAWSRWATVAVGWLVASGVGQAAIELGRPGSPLHEVPADEAVDVVAGLLPRLWRRAAGPFTPLAEEAVGWRQRLPERWERAGRPYGRRLVDAALDQLDRLVDTQGEQVLVNQDLHAGNVLRATREPWLVIDPKPLLGEREFAVVPIVRGAELGHSPGAVRRRLDRVTGALGLDRDRVVGWTIAHCLAWSLDGDTVFTNQVEVARWLVDGT